MGRMTASRSEPSIVRSVSKMDVYETNERCTEQVFPLAIHPDVGLVNAPGEEGTVDAAPVGADWPGWNLQPNAAPPYWQLTWRSSRCSAAIPTIGPGGS
jgi:hypothetical protein